MKKIIAGFALVAGLAANADVLYWMVDTDAAEAYKDKYTAVALKDTNGNTYDSYTGLTHAEIVSYQADGGYFWAENLSPAFNDATTYFVELMNGDTFVAQSGTMTGSQIRAMGAYYAGGIAPSSPTAKAFGSTTYNVPEPTSGLLFLVGGMLLGLKRRRQQV